MKLLPHILRKLSKNAYYIIKNRIVLAPSIQHSKLELLTNELQMKFYSRNVLRQLELSAHAFSLNALES